MAIGPHEIDWRFPYDTEGADIFTGDASHAFVGDNAGIKYQWRAISIVNGKAVLAADNGRIIGFFLYFNSGRAVVRVSGVQINAKNSGISPITVGSALLGATRVEVASGAAERGFVKAAPGLNATFSNANVQQAISARGYVTNGGGSYPVNTPAAADVWVMLGMP